MLEQQQGQLVQGLQEMYHRMLAAQQWQGPALSEATGHPLTHDILCALGLLEKKDDGSGETIAFEEDPERLQERLLAEGAVMTKRRGSMSSDSDRSHRANSSSHSTPVLSKPPLFKENFNFGTSPSPTSRSPAPKSRKTHPPAVQSPLHQNAPMTNNNNANNDPQLYQPDWSLAGQNWNTDDPEAIMKANFMMKTPFLHQQQHQQPNAFNLRDFNNGPDALIDSPMTSEFDFGDVPYAQLTSNGFGPMMQDFGYNAFEPMQDVDFKSWIATV